MSKKNIYDRKMVPRRKMICVDDTLNHILTAYNIPLDAKICYDTYRDYDDEIVTELFFEWFEQENDQEYNFRIQKYEELQERNKLKKLSKEEQEEYKLNKQKEKDKILFDEMRKKYGW